MCKWAVFICICVWIKCVLWSNVFVYAGPYTLYKQTNTLTWCEWASVLIDRGWCSAFPCVCRYSEHSSDTRARVDECLCVSVHYFKNENVWKRCEKGSNSEQQQQQQQQNKPCSRELIKKWWDVGVRLVQHDRTENWFTWF